MARYRLRVGGGVSVEAHDMLGKDKQRVCPLAVVASQSCCNFAAASVPFVVSLSGCHLLSFGL